MIDKKTPKFYFELDGLKYGAKYLTVAEQAQCTVDIDRLTNGKFDEWAKSEMNSATAFMIQAAVFLNTVICVWPTGETPVNFLDTDDFDFVGRYWGAYSKASEEFRPVGKSGDKSPKVAEGEPTPQVVPGAL